MTGPAGNRFLHAFKWSLASEIATKAIPPLVFIVLARLLSSEDYGVMAAGAMVVSFSQIFWEAGLGKAVIQRQSDTAAAANVAFWTNLGLAAIVSLGVIALAKPIATLFFHDPRVAAVLRVMSLQIVLGALASIQTALLQKEMRFDRLFLVRLATASLPGLVSIPFALRGMGYWALVAGTLAGQLIEVIVLWRMSHWRPRFAFDRRLARQLAAFGTWVAGEGLLGWFYLWADSLIVGLAFGSRELGLYWTGNNLVLLLFGTLFHPLMPVMFSAVARMSDDRTKLKNTLLNTHIISFAVALPIGLGCFLFGDAAVFILGAKWAGIGKVIGVLGLMHGLSWLMGSNAEFYKAIGRPDVFTKIMAIGLIYYIPGYYIAAQYGLDIFLWTRFSLFAVSQIMHFYALQKVIGIGPLQVFRNVAPVIAAAAAYVVAYFLLGRLIPAGEPVVQQILRMGLFSSLIVLAYVVMFREHPLLV